MGCWLEESDDVPRPRSMARVLWLALGLLWATTQVDRGAFRLGLPDFRDDDCGACQGRQPGPTCSRGGRAWWQWRLCQARPKAGQQCQASGAEDEEAGRRAAADGREVGPVSEGAQDGLHEGTDEIQGPHGPLAEGEGRGTGSTGERGRGALQDARGPAGVHPGPDRHRTGPRRPARTPGAS